MEKGRKAPSPPFAVAAASSSSDEDEDVGAADSPDASAMADEDEIGFAKLQGEDFVYYMRTYSIVLGRSNKTSDVDVDLSEVGGGKNISRSHARIFYDFRGKRFALEVLGRNGCFIEGVFYEPGAPPIELNSQDLLQIGDKSFYFLLPSRSVFGPAIKPGIRGGTKPSEYRKDAGPSESQNECDDDYEEADEDEEEAEEMEVVRHDVSAKQSSKALEEDPVAKSKKAGSSAARGGITRNYHVLALYNSSLFFYIE